MNNNIKTIFNTIQQYRFDLQNEKVLQAQIAEALSENEIPYEREVALSKKDVIDFVIAGNIGMEVKIKGAKAAIYKQCERYCAHKSIKILVLASNRAMGFPSEIDGKPSYFIPLGESHL